MATLEKSVKIGEVPSGFLRPVTITAKELLSSHLSVYQKVALTRARLEEEWLRFKDLARTLAEHFDPHRWYEFFEDLDAQEAANAKILNETPGIAADTMVSGFCAGVAPATQEWFLFTLHNPVVEAIWEVKQWLHDTKGDIELILQQSDFYPKFAIAVRDFILSVGGCFFIEEDPAQVFRVRNFRPGQYRVGLDKNGYPTVFTATTRMTLRQLVEMFGQRDEETGDLRIDNFSDRVVNAMKSNNWDNWIDVVVSINPNEDFDPAMLAAKRKAWICRYWELGNPPVESPERWLLETGYDYFPVIFFPWETNGKDAWAINCPGKRALPATKELYFLEQQYCLGLELKNNPPLAKHPDIEAVDAMPGGETDLPSEGVAKDAIQTFFRADLDIASVAARIQEKEQKINTLFMADFFRMLIDDERKQPLTATEVMEKKKEIMTLLSTAYGQITKFCLEPTVNIIFHLAKKQGRIRPAPVVIEKMKLDIKFQSIIAKALAMTDLSSINAATDYITKLIGLDPSNAHLLDTYEAFKEYLDTLSLPPKLMPSKQDFQAIQSQIRQQQAADAQAKLMPAMGKTAQSLSQADPSQGLLGRLMQMNQAGGVPANG